MFIVFVWSESEDNVFFGVGSGQGGVPAIVVVLNIFFHYQRSPNLTKNILSISCSLPTWAGVPSSGRILSANPANRSQHYKSLYSDNSKISSP